MEGVIVSWLPDFCPIWNVEGDEKRSSVIVHEINNGFLVCRLGSLLRSGAVLALVGLMFNSDVGYASTALMKIESHFSGAFGGYICRQVSCEKLKLLLLLCRQAIKRIAFRLRGALNDQKLLESI